LTKRKNGKMKKEKKRSGKKKNGRVLGLIDFLLFFS
jgi:hypothetical protein